MKDEIRNLYMTVRVSQGEKDFIIEKAKLAESSSTGAYIRKMAIAGAIVKYENKDLTALVKSLHGVSKNINQMAIRVNSTSRMYDEDFQYIREELNGIWHTLTYIQSVLRSMQQ